MFRTEINIAPSQFTIGLKDTIITIGSCFSDTIGSQFELNKFTTLKNPFGTIYNPVSIFKLLKYGLLNQEPSESTYLENDGLQSNYDFHSSFSSLNKDELTDRIEKSIVQTHEFLKKSNFLIITFGTAYAYKKLNTNEIVANCHKVPSKNFDKVLLTQKQILADFDRLYKALQEVNPSLQIILTVSPVRHIKDTLELNSVSKSTLRLVCHTLTNQYENVSYFPSYELLLDDLRDYRFYKEDMIHPTPKAEEYIWEKFQQAFFNDSTQSFVKEWSKLLATINHRPFNPTSDKHQQFIKNTIQKIESLNKDVDFSDELSNLKQQLV